MDRQDLKEGQEVYVKGRVIHTGYHLDIVLDKGSFIENAIILHHEKPVLPKTVAEWLEMCKDENKQLRQSLNFMPFGANFWLSNSENQEIFARAWLDGYVTDKEDRYTIKLIETRQYLHRRGNDFFFDAYVKPKDNPEIVFTRKDLKDAGFSWVFDCPGVEVQEVE